MTRVVVRSMANLQQQATVRGHTVMADEPRADGGDDMGATPYELLQIALASCIAITLRMHARRQNWVLRSLEVVVEQGRSHAEDSAACMTTEATISHMHVDVRISGELSSEQAEHLRQLISRCPVYQALTHGIHISEHVEIAGHGT